jgi:hypothetical protein
MEKEKHHSYCDAFVSFIDFNSDFTENCIASVGKNIDRSIEKIFASIPYSSVILMVNNISSIKDVKDAIRISIFFSTLFIIYGVLFD